MTDERRDGPVAIVTGGGSGIGRGVAAELLKRGGRVCLVGRTASRLDDAAGSLASLADSEHITVCAADLTVDGDPERVVQHVIDHWGRVDIVVNNAGAADLVPLVDETRAHCRQLFEVNVIGPTMLVRAALPHFASVGGGSVVNVSSKAVFDPFPGLGAYAASKCALDSLMRVILNETPDGVDMFACSIAPGAVETDMLRSMFSTEILPTEAALSPDELGAAIASHALRDHPEACGKVILMEQQNSS